MAFEPLNLPLPGFEPTEVKHLKTIESKAKEFNTQTKYRVRAIDVLYEADLRGIEILPLIQDRTQRSTAQTTLPERSQQLAAIYAEHADEIDEMIATHSQGWQITRMPAVDRAVIRLGAAEIMHTSTASAVLLKEYTRIAGELSTDNSAAFTNGLLQRIADMKELLT